MSSRQPAHPDFAHLTNLAEDTTGTFVVWASDDYFAEKENLLRPDTPVWDANRYTDKGKWMDGWESMRKREAGHDSCIVRLGTPGSVHGVVVDTTHFKGNAPLQVRLEGLEAPYTATAAQLNARTDWTPIAGVTDVKADFPNAIPVTPSPRITHLRLHILPDGGVARLRVYGVVMPAANALWGEATVDLASIEYGGTIAAVSDAFFGPPSNLLLPGHGVNMGDGWETKRRRTPGSDWCVIKLGRRGVVERLELGTHFFKGNAPQAVVVEAIDEEAPSTERLRTLGNWPVLFPETPLVQHRSHVLTPDRPMTVTHLRVHIFPHGGVNRLRVYGHAAPTSTESATLSRFNALSADDARSLCLSFCGSEAFADAVVAARPFETVRSLMSTANKVWWSLDTESWLQAFAAHPKIGADKGAPSQTAQSATWSAGEQAQVADAEEGTRARLATQNAAYAERFGFIFIVFATGKSAAEMLALLEARIGRTRAEEIETAAREQMKITRLRLEKWILSSPVDA